MRVRVDDVLDDAAPRGQRAHDLPDRLEQGVDDDRLARLRLDHHVRAGPALVEDRGDLEGDDQFGHVGGRGCPRGGQRGAGPAYFGPGRPPAARVTSRRTRSRVLLPSPHHVPGELELEVGRRWRPGATLEPGDVREPRDRVLVAQHEGPPARGDRGEELGLVARHDGGPLGVEHQAVDRGLVDDHRVLGAGLADERTGEPRDRHVAAEDREEEGGGDLGGQERADEQAHHRAPRRPADALDQRGRQRHEGEDEVDPGARGDVVGHVARTDDEEGRREAPPRGRTSRRRCARASSRGRRGARGGTGPARRRASGRGGAGTRCACRAGC